jgi:hypothetical protein
MGEPVIKSVADATSKNTLDEESGKGHEKPGMEAVLGDTSDGVDEVMFNTEYEADIIDEANVVREIRSSQSRTEMGESAIKSVVDAVSKNTIDEESGKSKGYGKPGMKTAMADINDVVMSNMEYEADIIDARTPNSEYEVDIQGYQGRELNMTKKHKMRDVKDDISDAVVPKHGTQVGHQGLLRQSVQEAWDGGWDAQR